MADGNGGAAQGDSVAYCRAEEQRVTTPTLFDLDAGLSGRADAE